MRTASLASSRVFAAEFFDAISEREARWRTELEARSAGPYRVVRRDQVYALLDDTELGDGAAVAELEEERLALLLAATLGSRARDRVFHCADPVDASGRFPIYERSPAGDKVEAVGWHSRPEPRELEAVHVADYVLRSPRRLAHFLEAAGPAVLEGAAKILTRRLDLRSSPKDAGVARVVCRYRLEVVTESSLEHPVRRLTTDEEQAQWLAEIVPRSPIEIGGGLYFDLDYWPIGYSQYDGSFCEVSLEPRHVFAPALLVNAAFVTLWHTHPAKKDLKPSPNDHRWTHWLHRCGRELGIPVLTSIVSGADKQYVFVPRSQ